MDEYGAAAWIDPNHTREQSKSNLCAGWTAQLQVAVQRLSLVVESVRVEREPGYAYLCVHVALHQAAPTPFAEYARLLHDALNEAFQ
jgi:hypothetical protein